MGKRKDQWIAGYMCAVSSLLYVEGCNGTRVNELFREGGGAKAALAHADEIDIERFREAGMLKEPTP